MPSFVFERVLRRIRAGLVPRRASGMFALRCFVFERVSQKSELLKIRKLLDPRRAAGIFKMPSFVFERVS